MDQKQSIGAELIQSINLWFEKLLNLQIGNTSLYENELIKNNLNMINIEKELKNITDNFNQLPQRVDQNHINQCIIKVESNMMEKINSEFNLLFKYMLGIEYRLGEMELNHLNNFNNLRRDVSNKCVTSNKVLSDTSIATEHEINKVDITNTTIPKENNNIKNIEYNIGGSLSPPQIVPTEYISNNNNINNINNIKISSVAATTATAVIPIEIKRQSTVANSQGSDDMADLINKDPKKNVSELSLNKIQPLNKCNKIKNESLKNLMHAKSQENGVANNTTSKIQITSPVKKVPAQLSGDWRQVGKKKKRKSQKEQQTKDVKQISNPFQINTW